MFDIFTTFDLSYLGDNWKDCYLKFHPITVADIDSLIGLEDDSPQKSTQKALKVLSDKFIEGYAISEGQKIAVTKETLKDFPVSVLLDVIKSFTSGMDKKKENPLVTSSEVTQ